MSKRLLRKLTRKRKRLHTRKIISDSAQQAVIMTLTEEFYQPARIHYAVDDQSTLLHLFEDLECIEHDEENDRWVLLFDHEATDIIQLNMSAEKVAPEMGPLVLASIFLPDRERMYVDINSFERLLAILRFFNQFVDRKIAVATHCQLYNAFSTVQDGQPTHDFLFGTDPVPRPDTRTQLEELTERFNQDEDRDTVLQEIFAYLNQKNRKPPDRIETLPLFFDDDNIDFEHEISRLTMILKGRTVIASEHHRGNTDFSWHDLIERISDSGLSANHGEK